MADRTVIPALKGKGVRSVHIKVAEYKPDFSKKYKFYQVPSRWLHELYPVDEIVSASWASRAISSARARRAREGHLHRRGARCQRPRDPDGDLQSEVRRARVPRQVPRLVPRRRHHRLAVGERSTGRRSLDARIETDPERFWDHYQSKVLPRIYDHVMKVTDNRPMPDKQPFHRDLDVEVWMSEPDFRIGVDEELVSSLESLHEDLYFVTLDFFDALGRTTTRRRLAAPGKIFPIIHPEQRGKPGKVHVLYAGNARPKPQLEVRYTRGGRREAPDRAPRSRQDRHERAAGLACRRPRRRRQRDRAARRGQGRS